MASFNFPNVEGMTSLDDLKNAIGKMTKELSWLLNHIDWKNISEMNILLTGGAYINLSDEGITVSDGETVNFQVDTDGKVSATGMKIRSKTGYPAIVMDPDNELLGAYLVEDEAITIEADYGGTPSLNFIHDGNIVGRLDMLLGYLETSTVGSYEITTSNNGYIYLNPGGSGVVQLRHADFSKFKNQSIDLQTELDNKATSGISTGLSGSHNHGIPNGAQLLGADGVTVYTWSTAGNHSHAQN